MRFKLAVIATGIVSLATQLSAQTISWQAIHDVPLDTKAIVLLSLLFLGAGLWLMRKTSRNVLKFSLLTLLAAGYYPALYSVAFVHGAQITITTASGSAELNENIHTTVTNEYSSPVRLTVHDIPVYCTQDVSPTMCETGMLLQNGQSCEVEFDCR